MSQYMVRACRLNPATVPQEVITKVAMKEMCEMRARIRRQEANRCAAEIERARMVESSRNRMLAEKQRSMRRVRKRSALRRAAERVGMVWAICFATAICLGERLGLWVYEPDEE